MKQYSLLDSRDMVLLILKGTSRNNTRSRKWLVNTVGLPDRMIRKVIERTPEIGNLRQGYFILKTKDDFLDYDKLLKKYLSAISKHRKLVKERMLDIAHRW